jgi:glyoxylase-like metal-dependent hydrolase (beta-lactamase superfamily II)/predicted DCC family thiol-disulfide oxidoreductase YuxK
MDEFLVYYDDQCEVCQAGVSWLRFLDRRHHVHPRVRPIALSSASLPAGLMMEDCLRELHVVTPAQTWVGWDAVARLARLFPWTWPIGALGAIPPFFWLGRILYRYIARNRYAVSRCRGGVCGSAKPAQVRGRASLGAFWSCRSVGFAWRLPLVVGAWLVSLARNLRAYARTYRRRITLLDGRLTLLFLGSPMADLVPLFFGERFWAVLYDGVAIDPGSSKMRNALRRHLNAHPVAIHAVTATHHHEEHSGNLEWLASRAGAELLLGPKTRERLGTLRVPRMRRMVIGQPAPIAGSVQPLGAHIATAHGVLDAIPTPGHSDDHVSFYDPQRKLLFAGDSFMGGYFSSPNPDVDSLLWIETLERLLELGVDILVEGHGHIHTLSREIPDIADVVIRRSPEAELKAKLDFFHWVRRQIETGRQEGMPPSAIAATCFPWGRRWNWERFGADLTAQVLSGGEFSRAELVRSFQRRPAGEVMPEVYEMESRPKLDTKRDTTRGGLDSPRGMR